MDDREERRHSGRSVNESYYQCDKTSGYVNEHRAKRSDCGNQNRNQQRPYPYGPDQNQFETCDYQNRQQRRPHPYRSDQNQRRPHPYRPDQNQQRPHPYRPDQNQQRPYPYGPDQNQRRPHPYRSDQNQQRHPPYRPDQDVVAISKYLSFILRHPKKDSKLQMTEEGYIYINDILKTWRYRNLGLSDVLHIVRSNDKQRFAVKKDDNGYYMIRATQGHSVDVNLRLEPILNPEHFPTVVHGTTYDAWQFIRWEGLKKMNRAYIHFASGMPEDSGVISGMRNSSVISIFIDLEKAILCGIKFFLSENRVILSKGDQNGIIHPEFFRCVINRKTGQLLN
ncbi:tRNA 2'-phosphotransferase 1 isoform X2 [Octopus sinensis]|uniref:2'-phosphotransferase n=1 Tax=Octopus sinensis TaxID=2607531 RepID=A0A7E6F5Z6_9MOLL|nr:tRNA 2'-phosphotransferase 1 isoform X2 [Octopus sinensis]